jgi:hypothetical protein
MSPLRVISVALCNRRRPVDFRFAPFATEVAWRCNMSRRGQCTKSLRSSPLRGGKSRGVRNRSREDSDSAAAKLVTQLEESSTCLETELPVSDTTAVVPHTMSTLTGASNHELRTQAPHDGKRQVVVRYADASCVPSPTYDRRPRLGAMSQCV